MIDDRLRSAAKDIRVEAASRIPPPLPERPRRVAPVAAGGLIIVALVVGAVLYSIRQGETSPATDEPDTTVSATSVPSPSTTTPNNAATIQQVTSQELSRFIGTYEIDYQDANLTLGQVGTSELAIEMTSQSFCLRFVQINSSTCHNAADGSTLPTQPESLSTLIGSSELSAAAPLISVAMIAPSGVDLSVLNGDHPVCALQQFPLPQFGTAVVWACQARGPIDQWELAATKDGRTLAAPTLTGESGDVPQPGPFEWARVTTTGNEQTISIDFTGGADYEAGNPCTVRYEPSVVETTDEVRVTLRAWSPPHVTSTAVPLGCVDLGYPRNVLVTLQAPLGNRRVVNTTTNTSVTAIHT
jgi:hypothetical protein